MKDSMQQWEPDLKQIRIECGDLPVTEPEPEPEEDPVDDGEQLRMC